MGQVILLDYLAVGIAGFLGAVARALLAQLIKAGYLGAFPVSTLVINLTGCFILCLFMKVTMEKLKISPNLRLAVGTGFCGAYTTFSAFSLETINLLRDGSILSALAYIIITSFGCVLFGWFGASVGRLLTQREVGEGQN